jgi:hypothetical protein
LSLSAFLAAKSREGVSGQRWETVAWLLVATGALTGVIVSVWL